MDIPVLSSSTIKHIARECGADLVGIGSMDRFEGAPPTMDPRAFFPAAKAVIGLGFRIPRGCIRGVEEGTQYYQYPSLGYGGINEIFAPVVLYELGKHIEDMGYEAAVYRNTGGRGVVSDMTGIEESEAFSPESHQRTVKTSRPLDATLPAPDVQFHFRIAAFVCGLGEIGYSKMFLTPEFGPLCRFAFVFTDAPLEPDPLYDGPTLCNRCLGCVRHCPGGCLDAKREIRCTVAGRELVWAKLDEWSCFAHYMGAARTVNPFLPPDAYADLPDGTALAAGKKRVSAAEFRDVARKISQAYPAPASGYNPPKCKGCLEACLTSLEARGILSHHFHHRFRRRPAWKLDPEAAT